MSVHADGAPQWLYSSWIRSCRALDANATEVDLRAVAHALLERWDEPQRRYHTISHLIDVLRRVDEIAQEAHSADEVRLAAWYHGAIFCADAVAAYDNRSGEDKAASALLAHQQLTALGVKHPSVERISELVGALHHHNGEASTSDINVLIDADLAILAESPQVYAAYSKAIREEYACIPEADYLAARRAILLRLQQRPRIFRSASAAAWEHQARENLEAELSRLKRKISLLTTG